MPIVLSLGVGIAASTRRGSVTSADEPHPACSNSQIYNLCIFVYTCMHFFDIDCKFVYIYRPV